MFGTCIELVLVKSCAMPEIHSTFDFKRDIANFFKSSSKRNARLTTAIKRMSDQISNKWRLQQPCQTSWTTTLDRETFSGVRGFGIL